ncbi:unnamed protein product [Arctia plantaginis]|uniref:Mutator-like transposase domain-containing protein n=1 Tax=Arctia plantaginis TaxID=874455 RepID=A0A8S0YSA7_ARCPL|nr:unnamed protein product [Arctia plantaginis]
MCVKNKYCCICAEKKKETPKEHTCYKNFNGASTAMESTIITIHHGFKQSIDVHGLIYSRFIADGDSSTYSKIINARPYPGITVAKNYCRNHLLRNYCYKLQQLASNTQYIAADRKKLTQEKILRSRKYICDATKLHKETKNEDGLSKDINSSVFHAFDIHENCNRQLCKHMDLADATNPFFGSLLWQKIKTVAAQLADKAHSLIEDVDSNVVERFNGVIAKLVMGLREASSVARAKGFNRHEVGRFYEALTVKYDIDASRLYNMDETVISTTTNKPPKVLSTKGKNQVGIIASAECGQLTIYD